MFDRTRGMGEKKMKLKFFVIGSCYSGYMFKEKLLGNLANGNLEMVCQHQHDSLISIMSEPFAVDLENASSRYQWDFNHFADSIFRKNIIDRMVEEQPDYLILDTYAEAACPVIQMDQNTYLTANYYIASSSVYSQLKPGRILEADAPERQELFARYAQAFLKKIGEVLPEMKIILVRAHAGVELADVSEGTLLPFSYAPKVEALNRRRDWYDRYLLECGQDILCLSMADEYNAADTRIHDNYNYEISHNHFAIEYYRRQYSKLQALLLADMLGGAEPTRYFNQAVCIIAAGDFPLLLLQAKIYKDFFLVYILIDSSTGCSYTPEQVSRLREIPNVYVMSKYSAPKGSYNELLAVLEIADMAFERPDMKYLHLTMSYDMPIRPVNLLYQYFDTKTAGYSFLNCHGDGNREEMKKVAAYTYRQYYYLYNGDESDPLVKEMMDESVKQQKEMGIFREGIGEFRDIYKGVVGGSLTRKAYRYCMSYVKEHPEYLEDIKFTRLRSEFFFHTILFNDPEQREKISSGSRGGKHDWLWDDKKKDYAELDLKNYRKMKENKKTLFVRKVRSDNRELVAEILKDIKTPYQLDE